MVFLCGAQKLATVLGGLINPPHAMIWNLENDDMRYDFPKEVDDL